jgi:hypothetical protein
MEARNGSNGIIAGLSDMQYFTKKMQLKSKYKKNSLLVIRQTMIEGQHHKLFVHYFQHKDQIRQWTSKE